MDWILLKEDKSVFASANIGNNIVINSHRIFMIYFQVPVLIFCVSVLLKTESDNLSFHMPLFSVQIFVMNQLNIFIFIILFWCLLGCMTQPLLCDWAEEITLTEKVVILVLNNMLYIQKSNMSLYISRWSLITLYTSVTETADTEKSCICLILSQCFVILSDQGVTPC